MTMQLCAACSNSLKAGVLPTQCPACGVVLNSVAPPGWEETVTKMKEHPEIDNPWALAWYMKNKGDTPGGSDDKKSKAAADGAGPGAATMPAVFSDAWGAFTAMRAASEEPPHGETHAPEGEHPEPDGDEQVTSDKTFKEVAAMYASAAPTRTLRLPRSRLRRELAGLPAPLPALEARADPSSGACPSPGGGSALVLAPLSLQAQIGAYAFYAEQDDPHPNIVPFKATLHPVDQPSDRPPNGSNGHLVMIPHDVAAASLQDLIGMPINVQSGMMAGHATKQPIGVITHAAIGEDPAPQYAVPGFRADPHSVTIAGHLWAKNFPAEVAQLRNAARAGLMGTSYEVSHVDVEDPRQPVWTVRGMRYTGAAALQRGAAAYQQTQLAAEAMQAASVTVKFDKEEQAMTTPAVQAMPGGPQPAYAPQQPQQPAVPGQPPVMGAPVAAPIVQQPVGAAVGPFFQSNGGGGGGGGQTMAPVPQVQPLSGGPPMPPAPAPHPAMPGGAPNTAMPPAAPAPAPMPPHPGAAPATGADPAMVNAVSQAVIGQLMPRLQAIESVVAQLAMKPGDAPEEQNLNKQADQADDKAKGLNKDASDAQGQAAALAGQLSAAATPPLAPAQRKELAAQHATALKRVTECSAQAQVWRARALILRANAAGFGPLLQAMAALVTDENVENRKLLTDLGTKVDKVTGLITDKKGGSGAPGQGGRENGVSPKDSAPDGGGTDIAPGEKEPTDVKAGAARSLMPAPQRKSLAPETMRTLGKFDQLQASADGSYEEGALDAALIKHSIPVSKRIAIKTDLQDQGLLRGKPSKTPATGL